MVATRGQIRREIEDRGDGSGALDQNRNMTQQRLKRKRSMVPCVSKPSTSKNLDMCHSSKKDVEELRRNPRRKSNKQAKEISEPPPEKLESVGSEASNVLADTKTAKIQKEQKYKEDEGVAVIDLDDLNKYWTPPDYSNPKAILLRELPRCQLCMRTYSDFRLSLKCLQSHGGGTVSILRCYLCYKIFSSTDELLDHFREDHTPGNRVDTLICPFCPDEPIIPFRAVSCHVCAFHVKIVKDVQRKRKDKNPASQDLDMGSVREYFHQLSSINPNRFAKCTCENY